MAQILGHSNTSIEDALDRFKQEVSFNPFDNVNKDKVETYTNIYPPLKIIHTQLLNGMPDVPSDTVAIVQHTVEGRTENIFISEDEEAYLISEDTGATISVINRGNASSYKHVAMTTQIGP